MIERSDRLIVLADGSKLGSRTIAAVAPAELDRHARDRRERPADELDALRRLGVTVEVANPMATKEEDSAPF